MGLGPPLALQAPSILPSDTELLIAASLDMPQIYEGVVQTMTGLTTSYRRNANLPLDDVPVAPFAQFEKRLGLKIKEDLLPLLGNEIAVSIPVTAFTGVRTGSETRNVTNEKDQADKKKLEPNPVILISLKDKDAARLMIPKIIDGLGFKGASRWHRRKSETTPRSFPTPAPFPMPSFRTSWCYLPMLKPSNT